MAVQITVCEHPDLLQTKPRSNTSGYLSMAPDLFLSGWFSGFSSLSLFPKALPEFGPPVD